MLHASIVEPTQRLTFSGIESRVPFQPNKPIMPLSKIIIVGAGPSGLLLGLLLSRAGITVDLVEMAHSLDANPRAAHYSAPAVYELHRAGVLDEVREKGFMPDGVSWRKLDEQKTVLCKISNRNSGIDPLYRMVCLPLHRLGKVFEEHLAKQPTARILYGHRVVDQGQDEGKAWVEVEVDDGSRKKLTADYVVGCDGANSKVRRLLFGDTTFPGFTWDRQIVATNMYMDFEPYGYDDSQFFIHPEHYHMVAKIQPDGLYRVTYGEVGGLDIEQLRERLPWKYETFLPGHPKPGDGVYEVVNFSPYKIHQRCAEKFRVGRILLAADAAHLCNPLYVRRLLGVICFPIRPIRSLLANANEACSGGMGLTGGIADVGSLYDALLGIHLGQADDCILDIYCEKRRKIWHEIINPISSENIKRLFDQDADEALEKDPFLKMIKQAETDKELAAQMQAVGEPRIEDKRFTDGRLGSYVVEIRHETALGQENPLREGSDECQLRGERSPSPLT
jgi:2-polyprenyl-6-methoxyphenol hydroxylase-like FAD-dependent oxidoreductase